MYTFFRIAVKRYLTIVPKKMKNKPDRATKRPDCVSACIEHVTWNERQMDELTDKMTE